MKIKLKDMLYFYYTMGLEMLYILGYYYFFNISKDTLYYSIIHGVISTIFLCWCLRKVEKSIDKESINIIAIINFIMAIYFQLSSIKYPYVHYPGFVENPLQRLNFNIVIIILIISITIIMNRLFYLDKLNFNFPKLLRYSQLNPISLFIITIFYLVLSLSTLTTNLMNNIVVEIILVQFFMCFILTINSLNWNLTISKVNICLLILTFIYRSMILGKRNEIMVPVMMLVIILLLLKNIDMKLVKKVIAWSGIGYILLSVIIFATSARFNIQSDYVKSYLGNRFDVTDLALTYFEYSDNKMFNDEIFTDAIINSIPTSLLVSKDQYYTNAYNKTNQSIGLDYTVDYGDTIISSISQLWPGYGSIIILLLFYCWLSIVNIIFSKFKDLGVFMIMLNFNVLLNIELTLDAFMAGIRNMIIIGCLTSLIYWILKRKKYLRIKL